MKTTTILAHHGSPGTIHDFDLIMKHLPQVQWIPFDRYKKTTDKFHHNYQIVVGYSFGCKSALMDAADSDAKMIILIAPYLFPKKKNVSSRKNCFRLTCHRRYHTSSNGPQGH
ncbi:MAG: hypothetical protein Fur0010_08440 [Bdellovibrio sp.]